MAQHPHKRRERSPRRASSFALVSLLLLAVLAPPSDATARRGKGRVWKHIPINRELDVLTAAGEGDPQRLLMHHAGRKLGKWGVYIDSVWLDGKKLRKISRRAPKEPFERVVREAMRRPVDVEDLLYFLDDVLVASKRGLRHKMVWVTASRARKSGIFLHPDDVFFEKPRNYGEDKDKISIDKPQPPAAYEPAEDGDMLGPEWTARFKNPRGRKAKFARLDELNPSGTLAERTASLIEQLEKQGATVLLESTVRDPRRGYLMWGAFLLSRQKTQRGLRRQIERLNRCNEEWELNVPIGWRHPKGWRATVEAARRMADAYQVVYATEKGARDSDHYDGAAVDITAYGLPRTLKLVAPDGARERFDLSDPAQSRDLNLSPEIIDWIEEHFEMKKQRSDYPHWFDDVPPPPPEDGGVADALHEAGPES